MNAAAVPYVPVDAAAAAAIIDWVRGAGPVPPRCAEVEWMLAFLDDGVVWGARRGDGWALSSNRWHSPALRTERLQEARLFGSAGETLLWPDGTGLRGRWLAAAAAAAGDGDGTDACRPLPFERVVLADRCLEGSDSGFSLVGDGAGHRHVIPIAVHPGSLPGWPLRLRGEHHLALDDFGVPRIVASRLVDLHDTTKPGGPTR